jgi:hypothetical protein
MQIIHLKTLRLRLLNTLQRSNGEDKEKHHIYSGYKNPEEVENAAIVSEINPRILSSVIWFKKTF